MDSSQQGMMIPPGTSSSGYQNNFSFPQPMQQAPGLNMPPGTSFTSLLQHSFQFL